MVIAILATMCININIGKSVEAFWNIGSVSVVSIVVFCIFLYQILQNVQKIQDKRLKVCAMIVAIVFATIEIIGHSINFYLDLSGAMGNSRIFIKNLLKWFGYATIFYGAIVLIFQYFNHQRQKETKEKLLSFFTNNKKSFFICMAIILLAWLPYLLRYFPGNTTADSLSQMIQALGMGELTNHHPIAHTGVIFIGMCVGKIFGNYNIGIACYSIIQMLIMSAIFSFTIYYMAKKKIPIVFRIIALLFFACYPMNALYSITMWKDIIFSGIVLIVIIGIVEMVTNQEEFFTQKRNIILFTISLILMFLFRNNGIYVAILTLPFLIIVAKKYYKQVLIMFCIVLVSYILFTGPFFNMFHIKGAKTREALSIPLQQFARILKQREDISNEDREQIYRFLPIENAAKLYDARLSDPIKEKFNEEYFKEHKLEFIGLWVKLVVKYPIEAIEAFLSNSYGYYYPEAQNWMASREIFQGFEGQEAPITIYRKPLIDGKLVTSIDSIMEKRHIPIVSMLFSIGFAFWVMVVMFVYLIYQKSYKMLVCYVPIWILWLTCLASPVFCEYRYIYALFISLPILIATIFIKKEKVNGGETVERNISKL